jgi:hypothetical protein
MKKKFFVIMVLIVVCAGFPRNGFSKDERAGLYAGPLSVVAETLAEKAGSTSEDAAVSLSGTQQRYRGETGVNKRRVNESETKSPLSSPSTPPNE